ncbi:hypothetical protein J6590_062387 [Homalodisca vitripennis]|nr:hypothetical protein J6590_062387 [Homalodisca vitripennis]
MPGILVMDVHNVTAAVSLVLTEHSYCEEMSVTAVFEPQSLWNCLNTHIARRRASLRYLRWFLVSEWEMRRWLMPAILVMVVRRHSRRLSGID